jgi:hypothetical protein
VIETMSRSAAQSGVGSLRTIAERDLWEDWREHAVPSMSWINAPVVRFSVLGVLRGWTLCAVTNITWLIHLDFPKTRQFAIRTEAPGWDRSRSLAVRE